MGDHALHTLIEYLLNMCMNKVVGMSYTHDLHVISFLYTHICFLIYVCFKFQLVSVSIDIFIFLYTIYDLIVLALQYLYILIAKVMFMLSLILFQMLVGIFTSLCIDFN